MRFINFRYHYSLCPKQKRNRNEIYINAIFFLNNKCCFSGERDTHGGGGFVCKSKSNEKIKSVELLDLWEGKTFYHLKFPDYTGDVDDVFIKIFNQLSLYVDPVFLQKLTNYTQKIKKEAHFINHKDVSISPPPDAQNGFFKKGCKIRGIAMFTEYPNLFGNLWVDMDLYKIMSDFEKAALFIHEAIYKILREEVGVMNSILTRKIIANLLSLNAQERFFTGKTYFCSDIFGENSFYIIHQKTDRYAHHKYITRVHLVNGYSETVHPDTLVDFHITLEDFMKQMPDLTFHLTGRQRGAKIKYRYKQNFHGYDAVTERDFELTQCKERTL